MNKNTKELNKYQFLFCVVIFMNNYGIVYKVTNQLNNHAYIGQTTMELKTRKSGHLSCAKLKPESYFHRAIRKYGSENFKWEVIDVGYNKEDLNEKEIYWIKFYNTFEGEGYNVNVGGGSNKGLKFSEEQKLNLCISSGGKEFYVFDLDGNYLYERINQSGFAKEINTSVSNVGKVLHNEKNTIKGYILIFKENFSLELLDRKMNRTRNHRDFEVKDMMTGEIVGIWKNQSLCGKELNIHRGTISKCLTGALKSSNGMSFSYL